MTVHHSRKFKPTLKDYDGRKEKRNYKRTCMPTIGVKTEQKRASRPTGRNGLPKWTTVWQTPNGTRADSHLKSIALNAFWVTSENGKIRKRKVYSRVSLHVTGDGSKAMTHGELIRSVHSTRTKLFRASCSGRKLPRICTPGSRRQ